MFLRIFLFISGEHYLLGFSNNDIKLSEVHKKATAKLQ